MTSYVFFGDSLSDSGNLSQAAIGLIPEELRMSLGGPGGEASNGPVWTEQIGPLVGADAVLNYAVAGGEALGSQTIGSFIDGAGYEDDLLVPPDDPALGWDMNLAAQIDRFLADTEGDDRAQMTAVLLVGGNDYGNLDLGSPTLIRDALTLVGDVVDATIAAGEALLAAGVSDMVFCSLPDAGFFPVFAGQSPADLALASLAIELHNVKLATAVSDLGADASLIDLGPVSAAIAEDATGFGLLAPYQSTLIDDPSVLASYDADQVAFWDSLHPTTATHGLIAAHVAHVLEGAPVIEGLDSADAELGGRQSDLMYLLAGDDSASGNGGDDILFGGSGDDRLVGNGGGDILSGGAGDDILSGAIGSDVLYAADGFDTLYAGRGDDALIFSAGGGLGQGGTGDDVFIFTDEALEGALSGDSLTVAGGQGTDTLYLVLREQTLIDHSVELIELGMAGFLSAIGITANNIEQLDLMVRGADADAVLDSYAWYDDAALWNLV